MNSAFGFVYMLVCTSSYCSLDTLSFNFIEVAKRSFFLHSLLERRRHFHMTILIAQRVQHLQLSMCLIAAECFEHHCNAPSRLCVFFPLPPQCFLEMQTSSSSAHTLFFIAEWRIDSKIILVQKAWAFFTYINTFFFFFLLQHFLSSLFSFILAYQSSPHYI